MEWWEKTPLNDDVRAVCARHFGKQGDGCGRCPIRDACHSGPTARLTYETMEEWRLRLNRAASSVAADETQPR